MQSLNVEAAFYLDKVQQKEYPILLQIWESSVKATHSFVKSEDIETFKQLIVEHKMFESVDLIVARDVNLMPIGFMGVKDDSLEMLYVHPEMLNKGVGKVLILHAITKLGVRTVEVNTQNHRAIRFYESFGFRTYAQSATDTSGMHYPINHMKLIL